MAKRNYTEGNKSSYFDYLSLKDHNTRASSCNLLAPSAAPSAAPASGTGNMVSGNSKAYSSYGNVNASNWVGVSSSYAATSSSYGATSSNYEGTSSNFNYYPPCNYVPRINYGCTIDGSEDNRSKFGGHSGSYEETVHPMKIYSSSAGAVERKQRYKDDCRARVMQSVETLYYWQGNNNEFRVSEESTFAQLGFDNFDKTTLGRMVEGPCGVVIKPDTVDSFNCPKDILDYPESDQESD